MNPPDFKVGVIKPLECFKEGWELIKPNYWLIFGITFVGILLAGLIPFGVAMGAMYCGIYLCLLKLMDRKPLEFGDLFKGFNYFVPGLVATLILIVPALIFALISWVSMFALFFSTMGKDGRIDESSIFIIYGVMFFEGVTFAVIFSCIHAFVMFVYPLIVEYDLGGMEAFRLSARAVWANLGSVIGLILWEFVIGFIGYLACGIGLYFTFPILFAGVLVAYRKIFPSLEIQGFTPPPPGYYQGL